MNKYVYEYKEIDTLKSLDILKIIFLYNIMFYKCSYKVLCFLTTFKYNFNEVLFKNRDRSFCTCIQLWDHHHN